MKPIKLKYEKGLTLIEATAALVVLATVMIMAGRIIGSQTNEMAIAITASQMSTVAAAVQPYVKTNYAAIAAVATSTVPAVITVPMLQSQNYLASGTSSTNNKGQTMCALVLQPTAGNLQVLVVAESIAASAQVIDDISLGEIASKIIPAGAGGGIYASTPTFVTGAVGGLKFSASTFANSTTRCDGSSGAVALAAGHPVVALWFDNGSLSTAYLYRNAVPGHPELNTMYTPLVIADIETVGAVCTTPGAFARDSTGGILLSCDGATWGKVSTR